jgi:hypothetical protein
MSRAAFLRLLIHRNGRHPERDVCPNDMTVDGTETIPVKLDTETAAILDSAADQMCMSRTAYCAYLMRHAGLTVTVALTADQMERLRGISDGNPEQYVHDMIIDKIRDT